MQLKIDNKAMKEHVKTLRRIHKSALPIAIRQTLNSAAFDVKQNTMPASAKKEFVNRNKTFFKANSKVEQAKGFAIDKMQAIVGFKPNKGKGVDKAVSDLEQQEQGGNIGGRGFIAHDKARVSKSRNKNVRPVNRTSDLHNIVNANRVRKGKNRKQKFIRAAYYAAEKYGDNALVLGTRKNGKQTIFRIKEIWGNTRRQGSDSSRKLDIKADALYSYKKGRKVQINKTNFMRKASLKTAKQMENLFKKHAQEQIKKYTS